MDEIVKTMFQLSLDISSSLKLLNDAISGSDTIIDRTKQVIRSASITSHEAKNAMQTLQTTILLLNKYKILLSELRDVNHVISKFLNGLDNIWLSAPNTDGP